MAIQLNDPREWPAEDANFISTLSPEWKMVATRAAQRMTLPEFQLPWESFLSSLKVCMMRSYASIYLFNGVKFLNNFVNNFVNNLQTRQQA